MLTLQFIPQMEIQGLTSEQRVNKLLRLVKGNNVILLEGKLKSREEADLIQRTMESINKEFRGIEIGTILPKKINKIKQALMKFIFNEEKGFTIIGPATIIKEIKQNPGKIQLLMENKKKKTSKRKRRKKKV
jgi:hypothetical protein